MSGVWLTGVPISIVHFLWLGLLLFLCAPLLVLALDVALLFFILWNWEVCFHTFRAFNAYITTVLICIYLPGHEAF